MSTCTQPVPPASPRLYLLRSYTPPQRTRPPQPPIPHQAIAQLFRLARRRHTFLGWLRFRLACVFASHRTYQFFIRQVRARYYAESERL